MRYILMETSTHGRYRVVHNSSEYGGDDPVFSFEYWTTDALGKDSWREVNEDDPRQLRSLLNAMCYTIAREPLTQEEAQPIDEALICEDQPAEPTSDAMEILRRRYGRKEPE